MRGEFQECGYECCIAMSHRRHRRYRHHLLTTAPPPPIDDRGKGRCTNDVHKNYGFVDPFGRISRNLISSDFKTWQFLSENVIHG